MSLSHRWNFCFFNIRSLDNSFNCLINFRWIICFETSGALSGWHLTPTLFDLLNSKSLRILSLLRLKRAPKIIIPLNFVPVTGLTTVSTCTHYSVCCYCFGAYWRTTNFKRFTISSRLSGFLLDNSIHISFQFTGSHVSFNIILDNG